LRFDTLNEWLHWQETLHPRAIDLRLERVGEVWGRLQPGGMGATVISVAGTNGKGSCVAMIEAILQAAGHRTGCYTSPHLMRYNERIRIEGREVADNAIIHTFQRIDEARSGIPLTYFEFGTLAALDLFARRGLDVVILEVGLGGRLDAVNIVDADAALITSIDIDHTEWLGETREAVGREKAGILRAGRPAVYGGDEMPASIAARARAIGAPLYVAGRDFRYVLEGKGWRWVGPKTARTGLPRPHLRGEVQFANASAALMALEALGEGLRVDDAAVRAGLAAVRLPGRFQVIPGDVSVVLDVAHNPHAAHALAENLAHGPASGKTHAVIGMLADKQVTEVAKILSPQVDFWYPATLEGARGLSGEALASKLRDAGLAGVQPPSASPAMAFSNARAAAVKGDRILVFGSFHTVGAVLEHTRCGLQGHR